jgi:hypothetical protein
LLAIAPEKKRKEKKKKENRPGKEWLINTVMCSQIVQISNYSNSFVLSLPRLLRPQSKYIFVFVLRIIFECI